MPHFLESDSCGHVRSLGAVENLFAAYSEVSSGNFGIVARIKGAIATSELSTALRKVQARHGLLRVGIRFSDGSRIFTSSASPIPLGFEEEGEQGWQAAVAAEIDKDFSLENGPLMRLTALAGSQHTDLLFVFHHAVADGVSGVLIVRDLFDSLAGKILDRFPKTESIDDWLGISNLAKASAGIDLDAVPVPRGDNPFARKRNFKLNVRSLTVSAALTARIHGLARINGTTVHGALAAAVCRASYEALGGGLRLSSPIKSAGFSTEVNKVACSSALDDRYMKCLVSHSGTKRDWQRRRSDNS